MLVGGAIAYESVATRQRVPDATRAYMSPFTFSCNEVIVRTIGEEWPFLAMHSIGGQGRGYRGVRPAALLAGALMSSGRHPDVRYAPIGAAIELALLGAVAHTVPESEATPLRRGVDWRYASAVIAADYLLATATGLVTRHQVDLAGAFAGWLGSLVASRAGENTAALFEEVFEFPTRIGAHLAEADDHTIELLRLFGRSCGRLFLLTEDLGALSGRQTRLDTTLAGMLTSGLSGIPARSGLTTQDEIVSHRRPLIAELETARVAELATAESTANELADPNSRTVLTHFAQALAEPGTTLTEATP